MKVVILAGGYGTRFAEETSTTPKPMITIGGQPILWHIMKHFAYYEFSNFVIALGYLGEVIKQYFVDYYMLQSDLTINLGTGVIQSHQKERDNWNVTLVDTGVDTYTAGRIKRLQSWLGNEPFILTYGDGVSNIDIKQVIATHHHHKRIATITAVHPPSRFGSMQFEDGIVQSFTEKSVVGDFWINGGYMVIEPAIFDYIGSDTDDLAYDTLPALAEAGQLAVYTHDGFWQCMDNIRDKRYLESLWAKNNATWKIWE